MDIEHNSVSQNLPSPSQSLFIALFQRQQQSNFSITTSDVEKEIRAYLNEEPINFEDNPLQWRKKSFSQYKTLSKLAHHMFSIPTN